MNKLTIFQFRHYEILLGLSLIGAIIWLMYGSFYQAQAFLSGDLDTSYYDLLDWAELYWEYLLIVWFASILSWGKLGVLRVLLKDYRVWPSWGEATLMGLASCCLPALSILILIVFFNSTYYFSVFSVWFWINVVLLVLYSAIAVSKNNKDERADRGLISFNICLTISSVFIVYVRVILFVMTF